jgi:hypothetical protein
MGELATSAGDRPLLFCPRGWQLQQFGQRGRTRTVHARTYGCLHRFQIQMSGLAPATENHLQDLIYFAPDFLADCFCRFFFCGVSSCSTGRALQICSLTANSCAASSRKR